MFTFNATPWLLLQQKYLVTYFMEDNKFLNSFIHMNVYMALKLARLRGLGPENASFLFRLGHKLLVTKERQSRTNPANSPNCTALGSRNDCVENLEHALIQCQANNGVGTALLLTLRQTIPALTIEAALRLELKVSAKHELLLVCLFSASLLSI